MSFAQKDRLNHIQHTLLPTTEKKFSSKTSEKCRFSIYFLGGNNSFFDAYALS
jgi:hypothetical protein